MRNCPNCSEILGNNVDICFNCGYDFKLNRVPSQEEVKSRLDLKSEQERIKREEKERQDKQIRELNAKKSETISKNPFYEYRTEYLMDEANGVLRKENLDYVLTSYANEGWRLHTMVVNEAGKNTTSVGIGGISSGTNATVDVTILVFERCIKAGEF